MVSVMPASLLHQAAPSKPPPLLCDGTAEAHAATVPGAPSASPAQSPAVALLSERSVGLRSWASALSTELCPSC